MTTVNGTAVRVGVRPVGRRRQLAALTAASVMAVVGVGLIAASPARAATTALADDPAPVKIDMIMESPLPFLPGDVTQVHPAAGIP